jgi:hypothetical protein
VARRPRLKPLTSELTTERIGICRIAETIPDVELTVVIPSLAAMNLNVALAVERQHVIGPRSKASRRQSQFHDVRMVPLVHACGDLGFPPTHGDTNVGEAMRNAKGLPA